MRCLRRLFHQEWRGSSLRLALRLESKLIIRLLIISFWLWRERNLVHVLVRSLNPTLTCSCTVYIRLLLISWTSQLVSLLSMHFYLLPVNTEVLIMFVYLVDLPVCQCEFLSVYQTLQNVKLSDKILLWLEPIIVYLI